MVGFALPLPTLHHYAVYGASTPRGFSLSMGFTVSSLPPSGLHFNSLPSWVGGRRACGLQSGAAVSRLALRVSSTTSSRIDSPTAGMDCQPLVLDMRLPSLRWAHLHSPPGPRYASLSPPCIIGLGAPNPYAQPRGVGFPHSADRSLISLGAPPSLQLLRCALNPLHIYPS